VTVAADLVRDVLAARQRLVEFVGRCSDEQWSACPLAEGDLRSVGVIVDHVADAYEYLGSFVTRLARAEHVEVSPAIVDDLNSRHASAVPAPAREAALAHLARSGDAFVALIESMSASELASGEGRVTIARFAEIAALHADGHRTELETALEFTPS
jgi:hypothetical protein